MKFSSDLLANNKVHQESPHSHTPAVQSGREQLKERKTSQGLQNTARAWNHILPWFNVWFYARQTMQQRRQNLASLQANNHKQLLIGFAGCRLAVTQE